MAVREVASVGVLSARGWGSGCRSRLRNGLRRGVLGVATSGAGPPPFRVDVAAVRRHLATAAQAVNSRDRLAESRAPLDGGEAAALELGRAEIQGPHHDPEYGTTTKPPSYVTGIT